MDWITEAYYLRVPGGPLTQGDILTGLPAPYFDNQSCTGILITPRCDLAHDKTPVINFLPLVSLTGFLELWGGFHLLEQERHSAQEGLLRCAYKLGIGEKLELGIPCEDALHAVEDNLATEARAIGTSRGQVSKSLQEFRTLEAKLKAIHDSLSKAILPIAEIVRLGADRALEKFKLQVAGNKVADVHFLPPCTGLLESPTVVMMRQVTTCSIELLSVANRCLSQRDWDSARHGRQQYDFLMARTKPERVLRLKSPYLEALMARFGALFARVGVRDIPLSQLTDLIR